MKRPKFMYEEDGKGGDTPDKPTTPAVPDAVKQLADAFKESIKELRAAPAPAPAVEDPRIALETEGRAIMAKADELAQEGKVSEAWAMLRQFEVKAATALQGKAEDNPYFATASALTEQVAEARHADAFKRWGNEVRDYVNRLSPMERIKPGVWDEAVKNVKARHFDDILADERVRIEAELRGKLTTPPSLVPRKTKDGKEVKLTAEEVAAAEYVGVDLDAYAAAKELEKIPTGDRFGGTFISPPTARIEPGRF